jgi:hypothetical protein
MVCKFLLTLKKTCFLLKKCWKKWFKSNDNFCFVFSYWTLSRNMSNSSGNHLHQMITFRFSKDKTHTFLLLNNLETHLNFLMSASRMIETLGNSIMALWSCGTNIRMEDSLNLMKEKFTKNLFLL